MYIKLLSTGACANITIREIILINIISSASWTLRGGGGGGGGGKRERERETRHRSHVIISTEHNAEVVPALHLNPWGGHNQVVEKHALITLYFYSAALSTLTRWRLARRANEKRSRSRLQRGGRQRRRRDKKGERHHDKNETLEREIAFYLNCRNQDFLTSSTEKLGRVTKHRNLPGVLREMRKERLNLDFRACV